MCLDQCCGFSFQNFYSMLQDAAAHVVAAFLEEELPETSYIRSDVAYMQCLKSHQLFDYFSTPDGRSMDEVWCLLSPPEVSNAVSFCDLALSTLA